MKKILTGILVLTFLITAFVGMTYAQRPMDRANHDQQQGSMHFAQRGSGMGYQELDLTESQVDRMSELREEFYNDTSELREELRALNWEMRDLRLKNASNAEIGAVQDEIDVIVSQLNEKRLEMQENMHNYLTDEQLALIEEARSDFQGRFGEKGSRTNRGSSSSTGRFHQRGSRGSFGFGWCH
ncbi:Spy/CpxP family protein refolding chaperone [Halanaerobium hydrogeniformans]|uniref:Periplasmic heavy metal sensor n=1 Tax=Halanaerobium hydrogeniformans TaxID=656519 RepID=E4RMC0_HALHG|nr:Spy/CpxP family protein refolding chaperone [Halanaerobium hydrogeniformans]ADQ14451.1 hypothetical protein Halsa_1007 [Halanaerobium hydrogeniformans]